MTPIRWGILGAAKFAREQMGPAINAAKGAKIEMLATSDPAKAAPFQAFAPDLRVTDSYEAVLADPNVDAVYVPLPNSLHVEWTRKAMEAGKHVLTEKPIAMQAGEIDALIALRDQTGLVAAEAYMIVHHPQWQQARALYQAGEIGDLLRVNASFAYDNSGDPGNIRNTADTGGGSLGDIGVYTLGCARFVSGREPQVIKHADITRENGVDVRAEVIADFGGFTLTSMTSMRMALFQSVTFHGSAGVMTLSAPFNPLGYGDAELVVQRKGEVTQVYRYPGVNHYVLQVEAFGAAVRGDAPYPCPLEFSQGTQAFIDMIFAAEGGAG